MKILTEFSNEDFLPVIGKKEYLKSFAGVYTCGYIIDDNIVLPFVIRKRLCFKWAELVCPVLNCLSSDSEKRFLESAIEILKKEYRISHILTTNTAIFKSYPNNSFYCKFGTYKIDLSLSEEELFSKVHSKHRNVIRKAEKDGIIVHYGNEYAHEVIQLMNDTYGRQGKVSNLSDKFIDSLNKLGKDVSYWVAKDADGALQGSAIFLWTADSSCYYLHGGSASLTKPGAMNLLIWKAMLYMKEQGVRYFDFVGARVTTESGSKLEGIQRFKSRFGADMEIGYMWRYVVSPFKYYLYRFLFKTYMRIVKGDNSTFDTIAEERAKGNM